MPGDGYVALVKAQRFPGRHPELLFHQVEAGDHLGHRVLHLQPGIHLQEEELAVLAKELHCSGVGVPATLSHRHRCLAHSVPYRIRQVGCRGLLHKFLVAPLRRAVTIT